jgi:phage N-6-adenine-methyltransferase
LGTTLYSKFLMYVRKKGRYYYLVEGVRTPEGKTRQQVLQYLGDYQQAVQAVRKLKNRETYLARLQALEGVMNPDCWQTPDTQEQPVLSLVSTVFEGCIGIDPTADEEKRINAMHHMTRRDNCLQQSWAGTGAVFMNPPFSQPFPFVKKLTDELQTGHITEAILLLKQGTLSNKGTGELLASAVKCFWRGRLAYINPQTGEAVRGADFDSVFLYFGPNVGKFVEVFRPYAASINAPL